MVFTGHIQLAMPFGNTRYAELFCQSNFSFLQAASHPSELIYQADYLGYQALAITDECSVAGIVRAYSEIKSKDLKVKLIVGSLLHFNAELTLVLLCPNHRAYSELCRIITNARRRAEKGKYQLDLWDLKTTKHCLAIWLPSGDLASDKHWAKWLNKNYPARLWLGYQRHLLSDEHLYQAHCETLSEEFSIPITACGGVLMHSPERYELLCVLNSIHKVNNIEHSVEKIPQNAERSLRPISKLKRLYPAKWLAESASIANLCTFDLSELSYQYPAELIPKGATPTSHLRDLVKRGMSIRFPEGASFAIRRIIAKELKLIEALKYEFFFLTISDIVQYAKAQHILYQGRGSAANSVVCYCLEITAVDPRQISVLFERFISKERNEPPDIDVDFEHERREEVIQYIYKKYGRERTAIAATVISYRQKSAIRDVGKALGIHESQLDFFIKNINRRDKALNWQAQISELGLDPSSGKGKHFIHLVNEIKGFPRHLSQHVGGFVISANPLYQLVPIENASMAERSVIQWDKDDLESLGLLKVDVLALGMLTAIRKTFDLIRQHHNKTISIADITRLPSDPDVYAMIQKADTVGVFQIESRAQMTMLPRLRPKCFYDLVIQIAIVRPGPIQGDMVHPFLKRRDGLEPVEYPSKEVESVLSRTMGVPIFQEQVIKIAMVAAGFSGGEADQLRRAMASWKKTGELIKFKDKLIKGMLARGYKVQFAEQLYKQICGFGEYGFPESHSASFSVLAYVSSWLKYYYPESFYCGLLNSWPMGFYTPDQLIQDAKRHHIEVLPVCINASYYDHIIETADNQLALRLGFRLIKGLSRREIEEFVDSRSSQGYSELAQLKETGLTRASLEALASANAFSSLSDNRYTAKWSLMDSQSALPLFKQLTMDNDFNPEQPSEFSALLEDYRTTGMSLHSHPIRLLSEASLLGHYTPAAQLDTITHKSVIKVVGLVKGRQSPGTASGVTFITLEDHTGNSNVIVWQATARAQKQAYLKAQILKVSGILERGDGGVTHIIAGRLEDLSHLVDELAIHSRDFH